MAIRIDRHNLMDSLSEDKRTRLVAKLEDMILDAEEYRANWDNVHQRNWKMYRTIPTAQVQSWPWKNAANYVLPVGAVACDVMKGMAWQSMFSVPPRIIGEGIEDEEIARKVNRWFFRHVWSKQISLPYVSDSWNLDTLVDGTGCVKTWWDKSRQVIRQDNIEIQPEEVVRMEMSADGEEIEYREPTGDVDVNISEVISVVQANLPRVDAVDLSYLFMAPGTNGTLDYPHCPWYFEEKYLTRSQLLEWRAQGYEGIDEELFAKLEERGIGERERANNELSGLSDREIPTARVLCFYMRLVTPGEFVDESGEVTKQRWLDEDGIEEEVILYYLADVKKISYVVPLTRERPDNRRPHVLNYYDRLSHHAYGVGVMDKLRHLQKLVNTAFNQMVDWGTLRNMPFFFFSPATTGVMPDMSSVRPGEGIPVNDPRGIVMPRFQGNDSHHMQLITNAQQWIERATNVTDFNAGRSASTPNSPRTARGMFQLIEQSNRAFAYRVAMWAEAYKSMFRRTFNMIRANSPGEQEFSYLNEHTGTMQKDALDLFSFRGDVDFTFEIMPSEAAEQQKVQNFFALMSQIPMVMQDPITMRRLTREVAISFGMGEKFDSMWPEEQLIAQVQQQQQQQQGPPPPPGGPPGGPPPGGLGPGGPPPGGPDQRFQVMPQNNAGFQAPQ